MLCWMVRVPIIQYMQCPLLFPHKKDSVSGIRYQVECRSACLAITWKNVVDRTNTKKLYDVRILRQPVYIVHIHAMHIPEADS